MMYEVFLSAMISPKPDADGWKAQGNINFTQRFVLSGNSYAEIAAKVDKVTEAITLFADPNDEENTP